MITVLFTMPKDDIQNFHVKGKIVEGDRTIISKQNDIETNFFV